VVALSEITFLGAVPAIFITSILLVLSPATLTLSIFPFVAPLALRWHL
jgi:hypothetical protein